MQAIGDEGDADWRSTHVGAAIGVFKIPTDMPCYEAATTSTEAGPLASRYII